MKKMKKEEWLKYFAAAFLGLPLLLGVFIAIAGITPIGPKKISYNFTSMYIALALSIVLWLSGITHRFSKKDTWWSWLSYYLGYITIIPIMGGVASLNFIYASFPTWQWIVPFAIMYPIAAILPFTNEKLSEVLHTEIFTPRSCLGKLIQLFILAIAPIAGIFGAIFSGAMERSGSVIGYSIMGLIFHFFLVWGTVSMAQQAWERRPWKK
ncbi:MAG: hypothetical protein JNM55_16365 [Anaerolineales bacterium]|nr:hypothetical protein [Anaerolineales bacterium]